MRLRVLEILVRPEIPLVILGITFTGDNCPLPQVLATIYPD
jgi:hypothetical protein